MSKEIEKFIKQTIPITNKLFIKALKTRGIELKYGSGNFPVAIDYNKKDYLRLNKAILNACKEISLNEWNNV